MQLPPGAKVGPGGWGTNFAASQNYCGVDPGLEGMQTNAALVTRISSGLSRFNGQDQALQPLLIIV